MSIIPLVYAFDLFFRRTLLYTKLRGNFLLSVGAGRVLQGEVLHKSSLNFKL
jgi:hypothetical protein